MSDPLKLWIIRNALLRGSNKYNDTLKFCELQRENYVQTIQRLHDLENQASLNKMHKKSNNDERINNTAETKQNANLKNVTCFNCGAKGHYKKDCPRDKNSSSSVRCKNCGKSGHLEKDCWAKKGKDNNSNDNKKKKSKNNKKKGPKKDKKNSTVNVKDRFVERVNE